MFNFRDFKYKGIPKTFASASRNSKNRHFIFLALNSNVKLKAFHINNIKAYFQNVYLNMYFTVFYFNVISKNSKKSLKCLF